MYHSFPSNRETWHWNFRSRFSRIHLLSESYSVLRLSLRSRGSWVFLPGTRGCVLLKHITVKCLMAVCIWPLLVGKSYSQRTHPDGHKGHPGAHFNSQMPTSFDLNGFLARYIAKFSRIQGRSKLSSNICPFSAVLYAFFSSLFCRYAMHLYLRILVCQSCFAGLQSNFYGKESSGRRKRATQCFWRLHWTIFGFVKFFIVSILLSSISSST